MEKGCRGCARRVREGGRVASVDGRRPWRAGRRRHGGGGRRHRRRAGRGIPLERHASTRWRRSTPTSSSTRCSIRRCSRSCNARPSPSPTACRSCGRRGCSARRCVSAPPASTWCRRSSNGLPSGVIVSCSSAPHPASPRGQPMSCGALPRRGGPGHRGRDGGRRRRDRRSVLGELIAAAARRGGRRPRQPEAGALDRAATPQRSVQVSTSASVGRSTS